MSQQGATIEDPSGDPSGAAGSLTDVERLLMEQYEIESEQPRDTAESHPDSFTAPVNRPKVDLDQDATSLDAQNFSVDAWLDSRKHLSLDMLLQQQKVLRSDIAKFKMNTQTLVHDNYSRFIAAADIIRTMRGEFEGMVDDTDELSSKTKAATVFSEDMSTGLQVNRSELADLTSMETLLLQLKALRRVPAELRQFVASRDFGSAVLLYSKAQRLLQSHGHRGLLRSVAAEAEEIMRGVHSQLTQMLGAPSADASSVGATVQMLRIVGVPAPTMRENFTAGRAAAINQLLESCSNQTASLASASEAAAPAMQLQVLVVSLNSRLLPMLSQAVKVYTDAFGNTSSGVGMEPLNSLLATSIKDYLAVLRQAVTAHSQTAVASSCPVHSLTGPSSAQQTWEQQGAQGFFRGDFGTADLVSALQQLHNDAVEHADALAGTELLPAVEELIRGSLRYALGTAAAAVEQTVVNMASGLAQRAAEEGTDLAPASSQLSSWPSACTAVTSLGCATLLRAFAAVAAHPLLTRVPVAVFATVQQQTRNLLLDLAARFKAIAQQGPAAAAALTVRSELGFTAASHIAAGSACSEAGTQPALQSEALRAESKIAALERPSSGETADPELPLGNEPPSPYSAPGCSSLNPAPIVHLIFSRCLEALQETTVVEAVEAIAEQQAAYPALAERSTSDTPPFVAKAIRTQLSADAHKLLHAYVQRQAQEATEQVTAEFSDIMFLQQEVGAVQGPRAYCSALVKRFAAVAAEAAHVLPPGEALPPSLGSGAVPRHSRMQSRDSGAGEAPDFERFTLQQTATSLFRDRGALAVRSVQPNVHSITLALCTHVLQSIVEAVRMETCSLGAVHQCQVDMRALQCALPIAALLPFFQDVTASCESRCLTPNVMMLPADRVDELRRAVPE